MLRLSTCVLLATALVACSKTSPPSATDAAPPAPNAAVAPPDEPGPTVPEPVEEDAGRTVEADTAQPEPAVDTTATAIPEPHAEVGLTPCLTAARASLATLLSPDTPPPDAPRVDPMTRLPRLDHAAERALLLAMAAAGGLPYWDQEKRRIVRVPAKSPEAALPDNPMNASFSEEGPGSDNHHAFVVTWPGDGRRIYVFEHMESPVSSVTSFWARDGDDYRRLATVRGELWTVEPTDAGLLLTFENPEEPGTLEWDTAAAAFTGGCSVAHLSMWFESTPPPGSELLAEPEPVVAARALTLKVGADASEPGGTPLFTQQVPAGTAGYLLTRGPETSVALFSKRALDEPLDGVRGKQALVAALVPTDGVRARERLTDER